MNEKQRILVDTCVLMDNIDIIKKLLQNYDISIPYVVLQELDKHKNSYDNVSSYKARTAIRFIENNYNNFEFVDKHSNFYINNDDLIIEIAKENNYAVATFDICMKVKCRALGIPLIEIHNDTEEYKGYKEICINNEQTSEKLAEIYKDRKQNPFNLYINEYLLVRDESGKLVDKMKYTEDGFVNFNNKTLDSSILGKIKPLDEYQSCLIDSLINNQMTMAKGKAGSGKSLLSLAYSLEMIEKEKYNKLIIFANPVNSRNSARLGYYPGTRLEKILDSFVGSMLSSKLGGTDGVNQLIKNEMLEILPFSDIRGYDTSGMKAIIYIVEAQNLDIDLMKLAIQRVSDDCELIIDGDYDSQVDMSAYEGLSNGMKRVSEIFRGQNFYGEVKLEKIHRSKLAQVANKM